MIRCPSLALVLLSWAHLCAQDDLPRIDSIANAASLYCPPRDDSEPGIGVAAGSIIAIFGQNLAHSTVVPDGYPLPTTLEETRVTVGDISAPLFFVSPGQINVMVPTAVGFFSFFRADFRTTPVVVHVGSRSSSPYALRISQVGVGIFTTDGSGCGQGLVYQVSPDGTVSINSPENSADPGKSILTVIATGYGVFSSETPFVPPVPDGEPTPPRGPDTRFRPSPFLAEMLRSYGDLFDPPVADRSSAAGRLPGFVAIDYRRFRLPELTPERCAVPLRLVGNEYMSQNVTISVRGGGGRCVDPPVESIALLTWERTVTSGLEPESVTEELRIEFLAAPGKRLPVRDTIPENLSGRSMWVDLEGPSCPSPVDARLHAGQITASGPGWGPLTVEPDSSNTYKLILPANAIREGRFTVRGAGGSDIGAFETSIQIPAPIKPASYPPGTRIPCCTLVYRRLPIFNWTGGDDTSWVRVGVFSHSERIGRGDVLSEADALASKGSAFMYVLEYYGLVPAPAADLIFTQDAVEPLKFEARGLTQGGLHRYQYRWKFTGLVVADGINYH